MKIALLCPHMFMNSQVLGNVIFSPGTLAISLADKLTELGIDVTLFSPGKVNTKAKNINVDLSLFEHELKLRGYGYSELLSKHPLLFTTLARQVQSELISECFKMANENKFELVHVFMNEEELALTYSKLCSKPVIFTHHDPFNFLTRYRTLMPKYKNLNWISISMSQRKNMPEDTNWIGNVYHGLDASEYEVNLSNDQEYFAYLGRIIEPKGVHMAIAAAKKIGAKLKIAGKFYGNKEKNKYWEEKIKPELDENIEYVGFISKEKDKNEFLKNAKALVVPSTFDEPFGMVMIEALASGTPIIGLDSGAISEIVNDGENGFLVGKETKKLNDHETYVLGGPASGWKKDVELDEEKIVKKICIAMKKINQINRELCKKDFDKRFILERMALDYKNIYSKAIK